MHRYLNRFRIACPARRTRRRHGFTAVELLVVLAIAAILVSLAAPSFQGLLTSNRIKNHFSLLQRDLQLTRAEALRTGQSVTICTSSNGSSCNISSGDWHSGWIIFTDPQGNRSIDPGDQILRVQPPLSGSITLLSSPTTSAITFNRSGFAIGLNVPVTLRGNAAPPDPQLTRCLQISVIGRLQLHTPASLPGVCL